MGLTLTLDMGFRSSVCSVGFACSGLALGLTVIGIILASSGMATLPKCRYGVSECYFRVQNCAYPDPDADPDTPEKCQSTLKMRAIEGSSDYSAEQLAIPILATCLSSIPAVLTFVGTMLDKEALPILETSKIFLAMNGVFLVIGIRTIQDLTFDCRWWADRHHGNGQECHDGFNLYIASTIFLAIAQLLLLFVSIRFVEQERYQMMNDSENFCLTGDDDERPRAKITTEMD